MWGFVRILQGPSAGGYSHGLLVRGRPDLCQQMKRTKIKGRPELRLKPIRCANTRIFPPPMKSMMVASPEKQRKGHKQLAGKRYLQRERNSSLAMASLMVPDLFGSTEKIVHTNRWNKETASHSSIRGGDVMTSIEPVPLCDVDKELPFPTSVLDMDLAAALLDESQHIIF